MDREFLATEDGPSAVQTFFTVLRKRKWSAILLTLIALGSSIVWTSQQTKLYTASAKVLLKPIGLNQVSSAVVINDQADPSTEAQIVDSTTVAKMAAVAIGVPVTEARGLLAHLSVTVPIDTKVLLIQFTDRSPSKARDVAQAFATSYVGLKTSELRKQIDDVVAGLQQQLDQLNGQLADADQRLSTAEPGSTAESTARSDHDLIVGQIAVVNDQLAPLSVLAPDPADVLQGASIPSEPSSPDLPLNATAGLFVGLSLGIAFAFVRERLDDRLGDRAKVEAVLGAPVFGMIPHIRGWSGRNRPRLMASTERRSPVSEAFRALRASLLYAAATHEVKSVMVTSPLPGEGKTTVAANLATVLAEAEKIVVLVSADLRRPMIQEVFGQTGDAPGLVDLLEGRGSVWEMLRETDTPGLRLLNSGALPENPSELLESERMGTLIEELREKVDIVVVDTAPILPVADSLNLAPHCDAVLVVVDAQNTRKGPVTFAREELEQVGAPIFGAVLNNLHARRGSYPYYRAQRYPDRQMVPQKPDALP